MNEIMNNILTRRSIRKFTDAPVSKEILDDLVQAALHAPSGCGKQTWKFTVITNKAAIRRLADAIETTLDRPGYNMYCPTAIIMPSNLRDSIWGKEDDACALENIFLAVKAECLVGQPVAALDIGFAQRVKWLVAAAGELFAIFQGKCKAVLHGFGGVDVEKCHRII